jgi:phosphoglycolate phosphatase-like HAD superfamily hydrolase
MKKLVLFDIDGTILWSDGAGRSAIRKALMAEMGTAGPIDGFRFDGKTDRQIVVELLSAAGHPDARSEAHIDGVCSRYVELLERELASGHRCMHVYAGIRELLELLEACGDCLVGLLTGNVEQGAALKLRAAGIDPARFTVGAFGSDAVERERLPAIAASRAEVLLGYFPRGADLVIIGDTPADVACGASLEARAIAVATGSFSRSELESAGAYAVFPDFGDPAQVVDAIFA